MHLSCSCWFYSQFAMILMAGCDDAGGLTAARCSIKLFSLRRALGSREYNVFIVAAECARTTECQRLAIFDLTPVVDAFPASPTNNARARMPRCIHFTVF